MENEHDNSPSDEERRTLWVGGIDSRVDEELLYELMLNVRFYFSIICNYINAIFPPTCAACYFIEFISINRPGLSKELEFLKISKQKDPNHLHLCTMSTKKVCHTL